MNPLSPTRRALVKSCSEARSAYLREFPRCVVCGEHTSTCVHEITDAGSRAKALDKPAAWLATCWPCNSGPLKDRTIWPLARQLAVKLIHDSERFDLATICVILGTDYRPTPNAVTLSDIAKYLEVKAG